MTARRFAAALAVLLLTVVAVILTLSTGTQLQEDDPGWDCRLHGNRICGVSER